MKIKKIMGITALALGALMAFGSVQADSFPSKPVQVVIPFQPGDTDNMLRPFLERMHEFLGQPIVLNYRPGAGGGIGASHVASSTPDGYTLVGTSPGSVVVVPTANKEMKYSTDDFAPVASLAEGGLMLVVPSKSRWKSLKDLVDYSKLHPGKVTFTSSGALGITHLLAEAFAHSARVEWTHIPYKGSAPAITALLGGHVDMASTAIAPAQAHIKAGTLKPLAVFGNERLKAYPEVPTMRELGFDVGSPTYYGILAPAGTPPEVINALYDAAQKVVKKYHSEISENLAGFGAQIKLLNPADYTAYLANQRKLFSETVATLSK